MEARASTNHVIAALTTDSNAGIRPPGGLPISAEQAAVAPPPASSKSSGAPISDAGNSAVKASTSTPVPTGATIVDTTAGGRLVTLNIGSQGNASIIGSSAGGHAVAINAGTDPAAVRAALLAMQNIFSGTSRSDAKAPKASESKRLTRS